MDAPEEFMLWFRKNYPGPDTIIHKPDWHAPKIYRAAIHAARADLARPKVKALVWGPFINDFITARSIVGKYEIERDAGHFYLTVGGNITEHPSGEAAKAAAQADYERRILAALEE